MKPKIPVALLEGRDHDPFATLGLHADGQGWRLRVYRPDVDPNVTAIALQLASGEWEALTPSSTHGLFEWTGTEAPPRPWRLRIGQYEFFDPYAFPPRTPEADLYLFNGGRQLQAWRTLGANLLDREGVTGVCFRVWAPNAERVSVVGEFNQWDGRLHPMCNLGASGVWELFIPGLPPGCLYRFEIRARHTGTEQYQQPCGHRKYITRRYGNHAKI